MNKKMTILFPSDYFNKKAVDEDLKNEYDAVMATGMYDVILFSYDDWFNNDTIILDHRPETMTRAIYRGWMMTPEKYKQFEYRLYDQKIDLITNHWEYEKMHAFPNIYNKVIEDTPRIITFPKGTKVDIGVIKSNFDRFKLKDYVKSVKGESFPQCFSSDITQDELEDYLKVFYQFRGDLFTGGICIKEFVDLKKYDGKTNEYRAFYVRGQVISICRNSFQGNYTPEPPEELIYKYAHLSNPFYTIDFAEKEDSSWIIIETGDGQVSGLSEGQDYEAFYRALYHAMTRDLEWRWCLVGNIVDEHEYGEDKEIRHGTKSFTRGTKVYIAPVQWGDGFERIVVLGKPRRRPGLIEIIIPQKRVENYRLKKIHDPRVLERMNKSDHSWWKNTDADRECIEGMLTWLNEDDKEGSVY